MSDHKIVRGAHTMEKLHLSNLKALEAESIHIIREVAAEFERPVMISCA